MPTLPAPLSLKSSHSKRDWDVALSRSFLSKSTHVNIEPSLPLRHPRPQCSREPAPSPSSVEREREREREPGGHTCCNAQPQTPNTRLNLPAATLAVPRPLYVKGPPGQPQPHPIRTLSAPLAASQLHLQRRVPPSAPVHPRPPPSPSVTRARPTSGCICVCGSEQRSPRRPTALRTTARTTDKQYTTPDGRTCLPPPCSRVVPPSPAARRTPRCPTTRSSRLPLPLLLPLPLHRALQESTRDGLVMARRPTRQPRPRLTTPPPYRPTPT